MSLHTIIPFLLAYVTNENISAIPTYMFQVRADTLFINKSAGTEDITKSNAGLTFDLQCEPKFLNILKCNIRKKIVHSPSTDPVHMVDNNVFTPSTLNYSQIRFRMNFDVNGAGNYRILGEQVSNELTLLDMYRLLGDQMSIGTNISSKGDEFHATETTSFGTCPTLYKISRDLNVTSNTYKLQALISSQNSSNETLRVTKYRHVNECPQVYGFILGRILWSDLILPSNLIVKMKESQSVMTFASDDFNTISVNTFDLYDEENKMVGYVHETITLRFMSGEFVKTNLKWTLNLQPEECDVSNEQH